jgi:uroporphyrinogen-III synthase
MITRPHADAAPLTRTLAGLGFATLVEPLLEIVYRDGPPLDLEDVQALLATSANGIRAFARRDQRRQLPVLAVGDATGRTARAAGFTQVESAAGDVAALADLVIRRLDPAAGVLLHIAAGNIAGDLAGQLAAAGFRYRREILYSAEAARRLSPAASAALRDGSLAGVLLYSPRTAATFARLVGEAGEQDACARLVAFCLSRAVAERVAEIAWQRIIVAPEPSEAALVAAVVRAMAPPDHPDTGGNKGNSVSPPAREP